MEPKKGETFPTYEAEFFFIFSDAGKFFLAHRIKISPCFTWTDKSYLTLVILPRNRKNHVNLMHS